MLHHTRGIVLHQFKYSETSVIARIYTEKFGLQSYLIKGVRSPKAKIKPGLLEHLSLLEMVVYYREGRNLQSIKEIRPMHVFQSLYSDIRKSSQALFINEVIYKSVKEEESNPELFRFLYESIIDLDRAEVFIPYFHLRFMARFTAYLGFSPGKNYIEGFWFNLREGIYEEQKPDHTNCIDPANAVYFRYLLSSGSDPEDLIYIPSSSRKLLLEKLIEFYELHLPSFGGLRSPEILHEVLS